MKWTNKRINVDLTDKAIAFIERQAKRDNVTFQEEMQAIFFTELQREMQAEAEGYQIIPIW